MLALMLGVVIAADVEPGPAVETAALDVGDVIGNQVIAVGIALIDRGPQLAGFRIDRQADGVANSGGVDSDELAFGRVLQNVGAMEFRSASSLLFDPEPTARNRLLPSLEKTMSRVEWPPARRDVGDQRLGRAGGLQVAVLVGKRTSVLVLVT